MKHTLVIELESELSEEDIRGAVAFALKTYADRKHHAGMDIITDFVCHPAEVWKESVSLSPRSMAEMMEKAPAPNDDVAERSYRRGCHQTVVMLNDEELEHHQMVALEETLHEFRYDRKPHANLLHEAINRVK